MSVKTKSILNMVGSGTLIATCIIGMLIEFYFILSGVAIGYNLFFMAMTVLFLFAGLYVYITSDRELKNSNKRNKGNKRRKR